MHTQHIAEMSERGRLDWFDNPLVSSDTSLYQSKCASLQSSFAAWEQLANFVGYLV